MINTDFATENQVVITSNATPATAGVASKFTATLYPNNASVTNRSDGHLTVNLGVVAYSGTVVTIDLPANLPSVGSTGDMKNQCFSNRKYSACDRVSSGIEITLAEDVQSSSDIEIYVARGF